MKGGTCLSPKDFTEWAASQVQGGAGLVPFIGSGVSVASGITTGRKFDGYLAWTLYRCIAETPLQPKETRLDLREQGWPAPPTPSEVKIALDWVWTCFDHACDQCGLKPLLRTTGAGTDGIDQPLRKAGNAASLEAELRGSLIPRILRDEIKKWVNDGQVAEGHLRSLLDAFHPTGNFSRLADDPNRSPNSPNTLEMTAVGSLHDWRMALHALARLRVSNDILELTKDPDQAVIDSFNIHITRGRKPNLAHTMLCHLAGRARIRTILTTNFDSLIEDAFAQLGERYEVIPVSRHGELPDPITVHSQNCIVKLHGGLVETRADPASPDVELTDEDKQRFFNYVQGHRHDEKAGSGFLPGLLLVCGYSGSDPRCVRMIKFLLDQSGDAEVLWVCHSEEDLTHVKRIFGDDKYHIVDTKEGLDSVRKPRIVITKAQHLDLLLYELYQRLTLSLPRGGFAYQFSANGPPGASFDHPSDDSAEAEADEIAGNSIRDALRGQQDKDGKVVVVDRATRLTAPLRQAFRELTSGQSPLQGMWLELEDYADTFALAHEIFAIIAIRIGRFQLDHARFVPKLVGSGTSITRNQWSAQLHTLCQNWGFEPKDWLIVLDGRNGPGGCASWRRRYWGRSDYMALAELLRALRGRLGSGANAESRSKQGFNILYAPYTQTRASYDRKKEDFVEKRIQEGRSSISPKDWKQWAAVKKKAPELFQRHKVRGCVKSDTISVDAKYSDLFCQVPLPRQRLVDITIAPVLEAWVRDLRDGTDETTSAVNRGWFLYAAVHFRQSRHIAALMSEAVYPCPYRFNDAGIDNDQLRERDVVDWQKELSEAGILFRKPGGHAWMHRDARLGIGALIENTGPIFVPDEPGRDKKIPFAAQTRAKTHFLIADWYGRAYQATGHAMPLLESLYHYFECLNYTPNASSPRITNERSVIRYRHRLARRASYEMLKSLRLGRRSIQFWYQRSEGHGWFSLASPRGRGYQLLERLKQVFGQIKLPCGEWLDSLSAELQQLPHMDNADISLAGFGLSANFSRGGGSKTQEGKTFFGKGGPPMLGIGCVTLARGHFWNALTKSISAGMPRRDGMGLALRLVGVLKAHDVQKSEGSSPAVGVVAPLSYGLSDWRDNHLLARMRTPAEMLNVAQTLFEAGYLHVRRAKLLEHQLVTPLGRLLVNKLNEPLEPPLEAGRAWVRACALCGLALDLAFDLHPDLLAEDLRLRIRANTVYGLALGRLGRFYEAHRRLNEAHALLSKSEGAVEPLEIGIIELRRTEVHLTEARLLRRVLLLLLGESRIKNAIAFNGKICKLKRSSEDSPARKVVEQWAHRYFPKEAESLAEDWRNDTLKRLQRQHFAKLDDATLALESAGHALSGKTHSSLWWGRLHTLRLAIYAEHWAPSDHAVPRTLAFRTRRDELQSLRRVYHSGRAASTGEHYFQLRLAEYAFRASNKLSPSDALGEFQAELADDVGKIQADLLKLQRTGNRQTLVSGYAKAVSEAFKKGKKRGRRRRLK